MFCQFAGEKVLYDTATSRCSPNTQFSNGALCTWTWISSYYSNPGCAVGAPSYEDWHWTNQNCTVQAKGEKVSLVCCSFLGLLRTYIYLLINLYS